MTAEQRSIDLNGFTPVEVAPPPEHKPCVLGYRVPHLPEVWFGVGFRDGSGRYWLGPRGVWPHYQDLPPGDVLLWSPLSRPVVITNLSHGRVCRDGCLLWPDLEGRPFVGGSDDGRASP